MTDIIFHGYVPAKIYVQMDLERKGTRLRSKDLRVDPLNDVVFLDFRTT